MFLVPYFVIRTPIGEKRETDITIFEARYPRLYFLVIKKRFRTSRFPSRLVWVLLLVGLACSAEAAGGGRLTFLSFFLAKIKDRWGTRLPEISSKTPVKCQFSRKTPGNCRNSRNSYFQIFASFCTLLLRKMCHKVTF